MILIMKFLLLTSARANIGKISWKWWNLSTAYESIKYL